MWILKRQTEEGRVKIGGMNEFEESLARLGDNESSKTRMILIELDDKLYSNETELLHLIEEKPQENDDHMDYYRGYDAILECVDDKEIHAWKSAFPYLHIAGNGLKLESNAEDDGVGMFLMNESTTSSHQVVTDSVDTDFLSLVVQGTKMRIGEAVILDDEVICCHGTLEEVFEVDNSPIQQQNTLENNFLSIDPKDSYKIEVVNSLYDALIPDLTLAITPLVKRMVRICREQGINYAESYDDKSLQSSEEYPGFESSDDGNFVPHEHEGEGCVSDW